MHSRATMMQSANQVLLWFTRATKCDMCLITDGLCQCHWESRLRAQVSLHTSSRSPHVPMAI